MRRNRSWKARNPMAVVRAEAATHNLEVIEVDGLTPETLPIVLLAVQTLCTSLCINGDNLGGCWEPVSGVGIIAKRIETKNEKRRCN